MSVTSLKEIGKSGENAACKYLTKSKYKIVIKNFTCKCGEIDIICENKKYIVFVEVKTRKIKPYISGAYSVNKTKQNHIIKSAGCFLQTFETDKQPRFDVIEVEYDSVTGKANVVNHIENSFFQGGSYATF